MDIKRSRFPVPVLCVFLILCLAGCRVRTGGVRPDPPDMTVRTGGGTGGAGQGMSAELPGEEEIDEAGDVTKENPLAHRKEYDESAPAQILPGGDRFVDESGAGSGRSVPSPEEVETVSRLDDAAEETAERTVPVAEADDLGVSEDAEEADSALKYYTVLLEDRLDTLFECKRVYVYWETSVDRVTVHRSSPEHALILAAGAYDVSARLLPENLKVDDGWVARKDPGVIVKAAGSDVLGSAVTDPSGAERLLREITSREGLAGVEAVKGNKVLILSEELLEAPHLVTAAELALARCAYPELFADVDLDEAIALLCGEATGTQGSGVYYYMTEDN